MNLKNLASVLVLGAVSTVVAHATPITGQFSITGASVADNGTTLSFQPNTIMTGVAATLSGSFSTILSPLESGTITSPITYAPSYTAGSSSFTFTNSNDTVTFVLNTLTDVTNGAFGNFTGTGTITTTAAGYTATPGTLLFTTQGNGVTTFSATANASAVPEPSTLTLLGTGILGVAGVIKRKMLA